MTLPSRENFLRAISLFCGAGIGEFGTKNYWQTVLAVDNWKRACLAFRANHRGAVVRRADVRSRGLIAWAKRRFGYIDIIMASPPCPAFSSAKGKQKVNDKQRRLYFAPLLWVQAFDPKIVVIENVNGIKGKSWLRRMRFRLQRLGYRTTYWILDAANYGTPQFRKRLFVLAAKGVPLPQKPAPTHGPGLKPYMTLGDAIGHLTEGEALSMGCDRLSPKRQWCMESVGPDQNWEALTGKRRAYALHSVEEKPLGDLCYRPGYGEPSKTILTGVQQQTTTSHMHPGYKPPGMRYYFRLCHDEPAPAIMTQVKTERATYTYPGHDGSQRQSVFTKDRRGRVLWDGVPLTNRPLSVRECLILQGWDGECYWPFRRIGHRYRCVGNGIAVQCMVAVAKEVSAVLLSERSGCRARQ